MDLQNSRETSTFVQAHRTSDCVDSDVAQDRWSVLLGQAVRTLRDASISLEERIACADTILHRLASVKGAIGRPLDTNFEQSTKRAGLAQWQIRRLKIFIDQEMANTITVGDLADLVRLSPHHFCRVFRASLNDSPHNYIVRRRIERARNLLQTTGLPLGQIAVDCGFSDQAHFNKQFRKVMRQSPGAWRRARADESLIVETAVYGDAGIPAAPVRR
jgi:transcriptional regulator GlxA family with amidase domain